MLKLKIDDSGLGIGSGTCVLLFDVQTIRELEDFGRVVAGFGRIVAGIAGLYALRLNFGKVYAEYCQHLHGSVNSSMYYNDLSLRWYSLALNFDLTAWA